MLKKTTAKLSGMILLYTFIFSIITFFLLLTFAGLLNHRAGRLVFTGIVLLIDFSMVYTLSWQEGYRDPNRVKYGHMQKMMVKGLVAGLLASIPYFLIYLIYLFSALIKWQTDILQLIFNFFFMPYLFIINKFVAYPLLLSLLLLPIPFFAAVGYILGYKRISLIAGIVYKKRQDKMKS